MKSNNVISSSSNISALPEDFVTPPDHIRFRAKKLFQECGEIADGAIAYLEPGGGGPQTKHTHEKDHLFIVVKGAARILFGDEIKIIRENESFIVPGNLPHSVWNATEEETLMVGITLKEHS